jgi:hypothetical protein
MSNKSTEERKQLEKRLEAMDAEWLARNAEIGRLERLNIDLGNQIVWIKDRLAEIKPKAIKVSDHAVLRYLERKAGVDVEAIRKSILESQLPTMVATLGGSGKFPVNGYQVVLKDYTVVTIN